MSNIIHSNKFVRRILIAFLTIVALFVVASVSSGAEAKASDGTTLMHAFVPHTDSVTGQVIARVNNVSSSRFNGWVCATEVSSSRRTHLGCLKADLAPVWSGGEWALQFGVTTRFGGTVRYTYQGADGVWRAVKAAVVE